MRTITLQIPFDKYGTLATLAAAANMPIDDYVRQEEKKLPVPTPAPAEK
jgi:hypothetical protein